MGEQTMKIRRLAIFPAVFLGCASLAWLSLSHAQPGENIEARAQCSEAVELEKKRQAAGESPETDLSTYCFDLSDSAIEDIDWKCVLDTMHKGEGLDAARQACNA
jgi:hypothetical protein